MSPSARRFLLALGTALAVLLLLAWRLFGSGRSEPPAVASAPVLPPPVRPVVARPSPALARVPVAAEAPAAPPPDAGPAGADQATVAQLAQLSVSAIRSELEAAAQRFPGVRIRTIGCVDRPCQAEVDGAGADDLNGFLADASQRYQGHVGARFREIASGDGATAVRATLVIGTADLRAAPHYGP